MTNTPPPNSSVRLLLAEDVRSEATGKGTLIGFYSDQSITIHAPLQTPSDMAVGIPSLCLLWTLTDGQGLFEIKCSIRAPSGSVTLLTQQKSQMTIGGALNVVVKLVPFITDEFGTFYAILDVDMNKYERPFKIIRGADSVASTPSTPATQAKP